MISISIVIIIIIIIATKCYYYYIIIIVIANNCLSEIMKKMIRVLSCVSSEFTCIACYHYSPLPLPVPSHSYRTGLHGLENIVVSHPGTNLARSQVATQRVTMTHNYKPLSSHIHTDLHGLENIVVSHPGASLSRPLLARLRPDLVEAWDDERSPDADNDD